jgi:hypothetical protein
MNDDDVDRIIKIIDLNRKFLFFLIGIIVVCFLFSGCADFKEAFFPEEDPCVGPNWRYLSECKTDSDFDIDEYY